MRLVHLSDLHVGKSPAELPAFRELLRRSVALGAEGIIVSGDLVDVPDDEATLRLVREMLDDTGVPAVVVPGNHDIQTPGQNGVFEKEFGSFPRVERLGEVTAVLFDSFAGLAVDDRSAEDVQCFHATGCWLDGFVDDAQFDSLCAQLENAPGRRLALVHHHLQPSPDEMVNPLGNAAELGAWCVAHDVEHVFVGHLHRTVEPTEVHGVMRYRIGRSTKPPFPLAIFDTETGVYEIRFA